MARIFKNLLGDGYTVHHDNGDVTHAYKNITNDGYSTYRTKGSLGVGGALGIAMLPWSIGIAFYAAGEGAWILGVGIVLCIIGAFIFRNAAYLCWIIPVFAKSCRKLIDIVFTNGSSDGMLSLIGIIGAIVCAIVLIGIVYYVSDENNILMFYSLASFIMPPILSCYSDKYVDYWFYLELGIAVIVTIVFIATHCRRKKHRL